VRSYCRRRARLGCAAARQQWRGARRAGARVPESASTVLALRGVSLSAAAEASAPPGSPAGAPGGGAAAACARAATAAAPLAGSAPTGTPAWHMQTRMISARRQAPKPLAATVPKAAPRERAARTARAARAARCAAARRAGVEHRSRCLRHTAELGLSPLVAAWLLRADGGHSHQRHVHTKPRAKRVRLLLLAAALRYSAGRTRAVRAPIDVRQTARAPVRCSPTVAEGRVAPSARHSPLATPRRLTPQTKNVAAAAHAGAAADVARARARGGRARRHGASRPFACCLHSWP
jgi:hypothetical protein